ncbi:hypothetical protein HPULCUR_002693 [Helicostylum pulchrum]|uniref:DSC E3 ubiquitin ligase complex subunit 3 ubiquitin-like domain-containing protein n=1 Tax=Helicostylum pulchrum TaxID=562976 RepID=A0ABP9XRA3_9FUNG
MALATTRTTVVRQETKTAFSSLVDSVHAEKPNKGSSLDSSSHITPPPPSSSTTIKPTCTIFIRLSNNGKDISMQIPIESPYITAAGLCKDLLLHLDNHTSSTRVKLIYLGRILTDQHVIVPIMTDPDAPLPAPKNTKIHIQKEGIIQAIVSNLS